jgi:hypothetical protein
VEYPLRQSIEYTIPPRIPAMRSVTTLASNLSPLFNEGCSASAGSFKQSADKKSSVLPSSAPESTPSVESNRHTSDRKPVDRLVIVLSLRVNDVVNSFARRETVPPRHAIVLIRICLNINVPVGDYMSCRRHDQTFAIQLRESLCIAYFGICAFSLKYVEAKIPSEAIASRPTRAPFHRRTTFPEKARYARCRPVGLLSVDCPGGCVVSGKPSEEARINEERSRLCVFCAKLAAHASSIAFFGGEPSKVRRMIGIHRFFFS